MLKTEKQGVKVPDRYNGDLLDAPYSFTMDFLILNLTGEPFTGFRDGLKIEMAEYGTKVYEHRAELTYMDEVFGSIVWKPRSSVLKSDLVQLQIQNHLFYTLPPEQLKVCVKNVLDILGLEFDGVNRMDLALDFSGNYHDVPTLLRSVFNGECLISGREKDFNVYTKTRKGQIQFTGMQIGKRSSSRFCRIYNKTLQMQKEALKPYIKSVWDKIGLTGEVWRFEYQLSNKFLAEMDGLSLDNIFDKEYMYGLFQAARSNHFELKENTGKSEVNKEKDYVFIDFSLVKKAVGVITGIVGKLKRTIKETFIGQQRMIKGLLRSYFSSNHDIRFLLPVRRILDDFDLWEWYASKFSQYLAEFRQKELIKTVSLHQYEVDFKLEC